MASHNESEILTPRNRVLLEKLTGHKQVKKFSRLLRNPTVHYSIHKRPPPLPVLNQISTVHFSSSHYLKIPFNVNFSSRPVFSKGSFSSLPTITLHVSLLSLMRATYPTHLILLYLITRIIFGEEYKAQSLSLCCHLQSPVISSLLGPNISISTPFSITLSLRSSLHVRDHASHPQKNRPKLKYTVIQTDVFITLGKKGIRTIINM